MKCNHSESVRCQHNEIAVVWVNPARVLKLLSSLVGDYLWTCKVPEKWYGQPDLIGS